MLTDSFLIDLFDSGEKVTFQCVECIVVSVILSEQHAGFKTSHLTELGIIPACSQSHRSTQSS